MSIKPHRFFCGNLNALLTLTGSNFFMKSGILRNETAIVLPVCTR
jgi:hypothetical protein